MLVMRTTEDPADSVGELISAKRSLGLRDLAFAVDPLGLYRIEPRALGGQRARYYPNPQAAGFDLAVVGVDPDSHLSWLLCQLALSQISSRASLPLASSLWQLHWRNCVVMVLTGLPSTNLSHVSPSSGRYSP